MHTRSAINPSALKDNKAATVLPIAAPPVAISSLIKQYGCGPVQFSGTENALYERHLIFDHVVDLAGADTRMRYEAVARSVRDVLSQRWVHTENTYNKRIRSESTISRWNF